MVDHAEHSGRVLQLTGALATAGGIETCVRRLSDDLVRQRIETLVLVPDPAQRLSLSDRGCGWPVQAVPFRDIRRLRDVVRRYDPDVIVLHHLSRPAISDGLRTECPTIEIVHHTLCRGIKLFRRHDEPCTHPIGARCLLDWYAGPCGAARSPVVAVDALRAARAHVAALNRLDYVFVGSRYLREYLIGEGIDPTRITVVDLEGAVGPGPEAPVATIRKDTYRLLFVGRVTYNKGLQYLLAALSRLDEPINLDVAGDGWFLPRAQSLARALDVADRVSFLGNVEAAKLRHVYGRADLVVVPSIGSEGFGLVVGDARRHGLPVVVSETGALPEWADDDPGVFVAPRADARALASVIKEVSKLGSTPGRPFGRNLEPLSQAVARIALETRAGSAPEPEPGGLTKL